MRIVSIIIFYFIACLNIYAGSSKAPDFFEKFSTMVNGARSYSFNYLSDEIRGTVVIARNEMYMSQSGTLEIYEKDSVRYSHNIKRHKVDIDAIARGENSGTSLFNWLDYIKEFKVVMQENTSGNDTIYHIERKDEKIKIIFTHKGEVKYISYSSDVFAEIEVEIDDFKVNDKSPSEYFTFNPANRKDLEVTDYR